MFLRKKLNFFIKFLRIFSSLINEGTFMETSIRGVLRITFSSYVNEERNNYGAFSSINCSLSCSRSPPEEMKKSPKREKSHNYILA